MRIRARENSYTAIFSIALFFLAVVLPATSGAQTGVNAGCLAVWVYELPCGTPEVKNGVPTGRVGGQGCPCQEPSPVGPVPGLCVAPLKCKAISAPGEGGKGNALDQGLSKLGEILGKLMEMMKKQDDGGQQGSQDPNQNPYGNTGCTTLQPTNIKTLADSQPNCYYYQEAVDPFGTDTGSGLGDMINPDIFTPLPDNLFDTTTGTSTGTGGSNTSGVNTATGSSSNTGSSANTGGNTNSNVTGPTFNTPLNNIGTSNPVNQGTQGAALNFGTPQSIVQSIIQKTIQPGSYGDVKILDNGTTIIAGNRGANSEVVGFFGTNNQPSSTGTSGVARLCASRPWASNFLSFIVPPSFFDSLCVWRGYTPGTVTTTTNTTKTPTQNVIPKAQPKNATTTTGSATSTPIVPPRVDIWASPATVPLGARTSIFWNSQGVESCIETSPDGSFSQNTLRGGASTVPLTTATTFTISCVGLDGQPYTDNVTVLIAI